MYEVEKTIESNVLLRIDLTRGKFLALENNRPLLSKQKERTIFYKVPYVVFIGEMFDVSFLKLSEIDFYPVIDGRLCVSFSLKKESDVRHLCLPFYLSVELLPAIVYYYYSISLVGALAETKGGDVVFVVDKNSEQREVIQLKMRFPDSRFAFFDGQKEMIVDGQSEDFNQGVFAKVRSADVVTEDEIRVLSENPVFAARVYLRRLEWDKIENMPFKFLFESSDIEAIIVFLTVMEKNIASKEELAREYKNITRFKEYFHSILPLFSYDEKKIEDYFSGLKEFSFLVHLRSVFEAQLEMYKKKKNKDRKKENYLLILLSKLTEIMPGE